MSCSVAKRLMELTGPFVWEHIVKRSRFIASASPVSSAADARVFIELVREADASHNCWGYRISSSESRYSDDGEPSGTAGKPIHGAIRASGVERVVVVVTRYFGGVKLGAGGLVRAYNTAAARCLREAPKVFKLPMVELDIKVGWENIGKVQAIAERLERIDSVYNDDGCTITVRVPEKDIVAAETRITNACGGNVTITRADSGDDVKKSDCDARHVVG